MKTGASSSPSNAPKDLPRSTSPADGGVRETSGGGFGAIRLTSYIQRSHAAPVQGIDGLSGLSRQDGHDLVDHRVDQGLHLLQRAGRKDMGHAAAALVVLVMAAHLEYAEAAKGVVDGALDARRGRPVDGLDGVDVGKRQLVGCQTHNGAVFLVQRMDGARAFA